MYVVFIVLNVLFYLILVNFDLSIVDILYELILKKFFIKENYFSF